MLDHCPVYLEHGSGNCHLVCEVVSADGTLGNIEVEVGPGCEECLPAEEFCLADFSFLGAGGGVEYSKVSAKPQQQVIPTLWTTPTPASLSAARGYQQGSE